MRLTDATEFGLWPTPQTSEAKSDTLNYQNRIDKGKQIMLCHAARMWPTPTSRDYKDGSAKACANVPANGLLGRVVHLTRDGLYTTPSADDTGSRTKPYEQGGKPLSLQVGGALNPTWVEWLMGYPAEWTALDASATPSSRKSPKSSAAQS